MQLKSLGNLSIATEIIKKNSNNFDIISNSVKNLRKEYVATALSSSVLSDEQKIQILISKGLTAEEAKQAIALNALSASETKATGTTGGLSTAFKGLAASLGISTAALGALVAGAAAFGVAAIAINKYKQYLEEIRQATEEAANAYKDSSSSIDDYVAKYTELREALIKAKGNEEETYNIKKQLLDLQTELNDKFGDEYGQLNLVTDAYKDQTDALKAYNQEVAKTYLNENQKGIKNATKEMTVERQYNLGSALNLDSNDKWMSLREVALQYKDKGIDLASDQNGTLYVQLTADAESAYEIINEFESDLREKAKELGDEHLFDSVLDISSSELNRAKETIDKYGEIYKQALMANMVSDDGKSETYNKAIDAVEKYNEAVLKSEDPFTDEKVKNARQALKDIQDEISSDDSWEKYGAIIEEVFEQVDTKLIDFNEKLQSDSGLQKLANDLKDLDNVDLKSLNPNENASFDKLKESAKEYGLSVDELIDSLVRLGYVQGEIQNSTLTDALETEISKTFDQAWITSFFSEDDAVKELGNSLLDLAEKGRLTIETFNDADSTDYFKNLGISADEAVAKINRLVDESKQLSSMSSQISSMADALGTKLSDGFVSADTLSGFDVKVRGLESWDRFQEVLGSTTSSYEECQEAANALATEWVNSSDFLAQLTEQNREYYETQLEAMGIENYEEVISYAMALNEAKEVLAQSSLELGNATYDEIEALIAEGQYSELTANMILALYDAKVAEQATTLDTSDDCANLIALAGDTDRTSKSMNCLFS